MEKKIYVNPVSNGVKIAVSTPNAGSSVIVSKDLSSYYSELARQWAESSVLVDNKGYSAKYYAQNAEQKVEIAAKNIKEEIASNVQIAKEQAQLASAKAAEASVVLTLKANTDLSNITDLGKNVITENVVWGKISGNISAQTDLVSFLGNVNPVGRPILELSNTLGENEIWLEGATVSRETYSKLFEIYGTIYGEVEDETMFVLPDFRGRALWGGVDFGYLEAGLPNITGGLWTVCNQFGGGSGCFTMSDSGYNWNIGNNRSTNFNRTSFNAATSNAIYGASETVQPPAVKVRVKTRYR